MALATRTCMGTFLAMAVYTLWAEKSPTELGWTYAMWTLNGLGLIAFVLSKFSER
jgi:4-amino-4-deoxy-L-arabinose transferase-like glycosyltransferase